MPPNFAGSWTLDPVAALLIVVVVATMVRAGRQATVSRAQWCALGTAVSAWVLVAFGPIAVYAPMLFWLRALQVLVLLYVVPFFLASARPVSVLRDGLGDGGRRRLDAMLASRPLRALLSPPVTSVLMLATPWLLYLTPWYVASMTGPIASLTRVMLVVIGFGYFYARLQVDPVPRRYPPLMSIGISVAEGLGDGILGLVLWLGPVIAYDYYAGLHRDFGPSIRSDQTYGAGVLWILGDVLGVPFIMLLMRALGSDERRKAAAVDAELDAEPETDEPAGLWWQHDPQLRDRYR